MACEVCVEIFGAGLGIVEQGAKDSPSAQRGDVDVLERFIAEELRDHAVSGGRFVAAEEARVKSVLRAHELFERGDGLGLDGDQARPSFLRDAGPPAEAEGDREQGERERAGEEQDSRSKFAAAH